MHIALITVGSRGDIQPFIALGCGLQAAGHAVTLVTHHMFERIVHERGLSFRGISGNPREIINSLAGRSWMAEGQRPLVSTRKFATLIRPLMPIVLHECWEACRGSDAIVYSPFGWFFAQPVMQKLEIPGFPACVQPLIPTHAFTSPYFPPRNLGPWYNRLTFALADRVVWTLFRPAMNAARRDVLNLPPLSRTPPIVDLRRHAVPVLCAHSPAFLPPPADWSDGIHVTGYWFLDRLPDWQPPRALAAFLDGGAPPVCVAFSSTGHADPAGIVRVIVEALRRTNSRGILVKGWGNFDATCLPRSVFAVESVPFDWLFPRVAAVIHHAGAGTMASSLRAGVPAVTIPFVADQPFWAARAFACGVGPRPLRPRELTPERLTQALDAALTDSAMRSMVSAMGASIRAEEGVQRAVGILAGLT